MVVIDADEPPGFTEAHIQNVVGKSEAFTECVAAANQHQIGTFAKRQTHSVVAYLDVFASGEDVHVAGRKRAGTFVIYIPIDVIHHIVGKQHTSRDLRVGGRCAGAHTGPTIRSGPDDVVGDLVITDAGD